jgi:hypothetical protein
MSDSGEVNFALRRLAVHKSMKRRATGVARPSKDFRPSNRDTL